jgi:hypothetical protein
MRQPHGRKRWLMRPTSDFATRRPCKRKRWPTTPSRNVAESRLHVLQHWQSRCQLWNKVVESWWIPLQCRRRRLLPTSVVTKKRRNAARGWGKRRWPRISSVRRKPPKNSAVQMMSALWLQYCRTTLATQQFGTFE